LIQYLVKSAGYDANFLLNVGPMPNGKIQDEHKELLKGMGEWLAKNGETIYGTRGGPLSARNWGVTTQKGNKVYLHVLNWYDETLTIPNLSKKPLPGSIRTKRPLNFRRPPLG
jgi:alpha-L-fucosidase